MTQQGLQPASPADLRAQLIALVAATVPDYTANLPGSLIEDISSTDTFALVESDSFLVDLVNSVTPYGANAFLLNQLGVLYGVDKQPITNTAVYVVFNGPPGYVIAQGFVVSDGTYQYVCQDAAICGTDGNTLPVYALATVPGAWDVLPNTVTQFATSVPLSIGLTCSNPVTGIPSLSGEPISVFRERCFTAGLAASTGMGRYLKTLVGNVPGVHNRLIAVTADGDNFVVMVGGGDPYQVALAIWQADFNTLGLSGAALRISGVSNANPAEVTTATYHNLVTGDVELITGIVGMDLLNNHQYVITVTGLFTFTIQTTDPTPVNIDSRPMGTYQYGGIVSPNPINQLVTIQDYPDSYAVNYVIPALEAVTIVCVWKTSSPNFVSADAIAQAAVPAIVDYINSLPVGITPINKNVLNSVFLNAVSDILASELIIEIDWVINLNGQPPIARRVVGDVVYGDPYTYFYIENGQVSVLQAL